MSNQHLLIMRFSAMGDVAMLVPVVHSLARQYPDLHISVLSRGFARALFSNLAPNVSFMEVDFKGEDNGKLGLSRLYRRLKAKHFTAVADMHGVLRSHYLRWRFTLDRVPVAHIDKHRNGRKRLVARVNKKLIQQPSPFDNYAEVLTRLGYPVRMEFSSIFPPQGGDLSLLPSVVGEKTEGASWIGIAPFAAHQGKIYPIEQMEQVVSLLCLRHPKARIFLFGRGDTETPILTRWCTDYPQCTDASQTAASLVQELILMSHLDVMLSMDSANMHFASLVGTPVVSVWGATHPVAGFMGWGQSVDDAVQLPLTCRPCSIYGNKPCRFGTWECMKDISPDTIVGKVEKHLE